MADTLDSADIPEPLYDFCAIVKIPVLWGDMDLLGHVNNTRHFRWFESSRVAYLDHADLRAALQRNSWGPILASINCNYRRQIVYPDTIMVGSQISRLGRSSMTMDHRIVSVRHGQIAADGQSVVVMFDYQNQRPVRIPDTMRQAIETHEGRSIPE